MCGCACQPSVDMMKKVFSHVQEYKNATRKRTRLTCALLLACLSWVLLAIGLYTSGLTVHFRMSPVIFQSAVRNYTAGELNKQSQYHYGRSKQDGNWKIVSSRHYFYVYSAFYDDRKSLSAPPVVRVIGVSSEFNEGLGHCVLYYDDTDATIVTVPVKSSPIGAGIFYRAMLLKEYLYTCTLKDDRIPYQVALILHHTDTPKAFLPVEIPEHSSQKANFVLCMSVAYWHDPVHIIEWMELIRMFGVDLIVVYNSSLADESARVFKYYDEVEGIVDFRQSHSFIIDHETKPLHIQMTPVINDCMYRNMHRFKKVVVTDMDELVVPRLHSSYSEMLRTIDRLDPSNHPARSYTFHNDYFFLDLPSTNTNNQTAHLTTQRQLLRIEPSNVGYACKSIIDPQACITMHNHFCWEYTKLYNNGDQILFVGKDIGLNHHYKMCHFDDFEGDIGKCDRLMKTAVDDHYMLRFQNELMERVAKQMKKLNLQR